MSPAYEIPNEFDALPDAALITREHAIAAAQNALRNQGYAVAKHLEAALAQPCQECEALRVKLAEAEREAAMWHREALDWQQAKSEADDSAEQAERQLEQAREALLDCRPVIAHGLSGGSAGDALRYVDRAIVRALAAADAREGETA